MYGAGIAAVTFFAAPSVNNIFSFLFDQPETATGMPWLIYWAIATLAPLILSVGVWIAICKYRAVWLPHLVFIPLAIFIFGKSVSSLLKTSGVLDHDMQEADLMALAGGYLTLSLLVHVTALAVASVAGLRRLATGANPS